MQLENNRTYIYINNLVRSVTIFIILFNEFDKAIQYY